MFDERLPKTLDWGLAALLVFALKHYYSAADTNDLQWLLYPLVLLLQSVSPLGFVELPNGGWWETRQQISIVKACAGGNFFIISLLGYLWSLPFRQRPLCRLLIAVLGAWLSTLCANGLRILLSVYAENALADALALGMDDTHRLLGIVSYFSGLCLQLTLLRRQDLGMSMLVAAGLYLGVTLCLPWLNGWMHGRYSLNLRHAFWVVAVPLGLIVSVYGTKKLETSIQCQTRSGKTHAHLIKNRSSFQGMDKNIL
ncbi:MAG: exosortase K [Gammaproteobacteria bacterium]